jgi:hypothetical protein
MPDSAPFVGCIAAGNSHFHFFRQASDLTIKQQAQVSYFDHNLNEFGLNITYRV